MMSEMAEIQADLLSLVEERTLLTTPCINTMITVNRDMNRCAGVEQQQGIQMASVNTSTLFRVLDNQSDVSKCVEVSN